MHREEMQERREEEEAVSWRQQEELRALERDVGVALPATPPPRVIRVGEAAPQRDQRGGTLMGGEAFPWRQLVPSPRQRRP